ncbi:hypothetical protein SAMN04488483_1780 [Pseudomonas helmanticensis]|uniref:Uncharacterized protein n=1 Tax=Pseudomonas helmanticensis TaxID=1471381 RepID=A0ACD2U3L8_9PSED|nr:hypothetical protein [Pseudomonas helmanticensis]SMQ24646.1 hypothetical protein SAMN04488483_1780 [Pseudomonas helmanticensis]
MLNHKIAVFTLAAFLSGSSLYAIAAGETPTPTANDGTSQTREPAAPATNADPAANSLPQGGDGGKTDNGPVPSASKPSGAGQSTGNSSGGNGGG